MNANIKNAQIFNLIKYDLNGHLRTQNVTLSSYNLNLRSYRKLVVLVFILMPQIQKKSFLKSGFETK